MLLKCLEWYSSGHRKVPTPFPLNVHLSFNGNGTGTFLCEFFHILLKRGVPLHPWIPPLDPPLDMNCLLASTKLFFSESLFLETSRQYSTRYGLKQCVQCVKVMYRVMHEVILCCSWPSD